MTPPSDRRTYSPHDQKLQQSLSACTKDGVAAQVMISIIDTYIVPFGLLLGADNQQIGWLVAIPNLLASLTQAWAVSAVNYTGSRLRVITRGVFIQALFLLPIGFLAFFPASHKLTILTVLICIYKIIAGVTGPAWGSLVSEYLPAHRRGDYFGWRSRIMGITSLVTLAFWGTFLFWWNKRVTPQSGFLIMFLASTAARFVSYNLLTHMMDLPFQKTQESEFTLWMFLKRIRESNFVRYVFYVAGITFATNLSAPYFSVHMLRDLNFNYLSFMAVTLASTLTSLIAFPLWGRHADQVGNARILKTTGSLVGLIPIMWIFFHKMFPLFLIEAFAGFVWGGFNLCAVNYIYDAVSPSKRLRCLGYFNLINGLAIFAGASLGGWMSTRLPPIFGFPLLSLFLVSAAGRFLVHLLWSGQFQEVRTEVKPISSTKLFFSVVGLNPMIGRNTEANVMNPNVNFGTKPR